MKRRRPISLKRRLIVQFLIFQVAILFLFGIGFVAYLVHEDEGGVLISPKFAEVAARAIDRQADGSLRLNETPELAKLKRTAGDFWFVARSDRGEIVETGTVPELFAVMARNLDKITFADIRDTTWPYSNLAVVRRAFGPAGEFTVLGKGNLFSTTFVVLFLSNLLMVPILLLLALVTIIGVPWIVRRAFSSLSSIAEEAEAIDIDRRGYRLPLADVPNEVRPLVNAINGVLNRLDEGYERHQRFILDAAHELRTPVAILQTRVEGISESQLRTHLLADAWRIASLAEQLLDLQRLDSGGHSFVDVDLEGLCRETAADLAPLAIAHGYELSLEVDAKDLVIRADKGALQRVLTNVVQNAIEHGGGRGTILIRVERPAVIEISDEGPGVPADERERIFEPFYRLQPRTRGAGLGLNLVREIMQRHDGSVTVIDTSHGGACFRLVFPGEQAR
ncbi:MAG: two-component sensor histidine kinase [Proteobacteria bacterium]|nr:two-component sensor histidine kinase [Pseudomonadota bacterium]